ncbi:MAG TPA: leucine-rich repeat domain-containing protein [Clostridia bacterium]|nr:leucine-rich repeat domain-containing protein [Clostridia bacterium]
MKVLKKIAVLLLVISTVLLASSCSSSVKVDKILDAEVVSSESNEHYKYELYKKYAVITRYKGSDENLEISEKLGRKKVVAFGEYSFAGIIELKTVKIPDTVVLVAEYAFWNSNLSSIEVPKSVEVIENSAFMSSLALESITFVDNGVKKIGESAFQFCSALKTIELPEGLIEIGDSAFSGCRGLEKVTIPSSVEKIGASTFDGNSEMIFVVESNSYAHQYVKKNGYAFIAS